LGVGVVRAKPANSHTQMEGLEMPKSLQTFPEKGVSSKI